MIKSIVIWIVLIDGEETTLIWKFLCFHLFLTVFSVNSVILVGLYQA